MKWQIRLARNALFGLLPTRLQEKARAAKRAVSPDNAELDQWTLSEGIKQIKLLRQAGCDPRGKDCLEIGTGWHPIVPLIFYLAGCHKLTLIDSQKLLHESSLVQAAKGMSEHADRLSTELSIPQAEITEKLAPRPAGLPLQFLLDSYNMEYCAPANILSNGLPAAALDIIISKEVLEHVPPEIVKAIFLECKRLLRPDGKMCHFIDNSDHREHRDKSLSRLSYLQYSNKTFRFLTRWNPLDYENRLRHPQYKTMMEEAGFTILIDDSQVDQKALEGLEQITVDECFRGIPKCELAIVNSHLVAAHGGGR
jgi:SAM-dependent methyltransferase